MKIGCIVQARNTSSRLPGKVTKILDYEKDTTVLEEVICRLKKAEKIDSIIIATTCNREDDSIVDIGEKKGTAVFRGSENDVLERFYLAANANKLDVVIRVTSDCPFIDPEIIDDLVELFCKGQYDYASNCVTRTYPHGLDCEIFSMNALANAYHDTEFTEKDKFYREHVTTYMHTQPELFKIGSLVCSEGVYNSIRITVDTKEDYLLACVIKSLLGDNYSYRDIIDLFEKKPFLSEINASSVQKRKFDNKRDEMNAAIKLLRLQEMNSVADWLDNNYNEK